VLVLPSGVALAKPPSPRELGSQRSGGKKTNVGSFPEQRETSVRTGHEGAGSTLAFASLFGETLPPGELEQLATTPTQANANPVVSAATRSKENVNERERFTERQRKYSLG